VSSATPTYGTDWISQVVLLMCCFKPRSSLDY